MEGKNILIISPFFYPELISTGKFNYEFALSLKSFNNKVKVLCYHPFYPKWKIEESNKSVLDIEIIRGGSWIKFPKSQFLRRLILEISFAFFVFRNYSKISKDIDVVIPVFPPSLMFYFLINKIKNKTKKIGMVHDLQEIYSKDNNNIFNRLIKKVIHQIEKKCYQNCDKLIFLSNEMRNEAVELYKLKQQNLITQYPFISIKGDQTKELDGVFKEGINIVYSGALGEKQNPFELLNFFDEASKQIENSNYYIFSQGKFFESLKMQNKNPNILFLDLVPEKNLVELYNKSTVQIIPQKQNTSKGSLPSKLPNLLASKCKVFVITDKNSEIEFLFKNNNLETTVNTWQVEKLIDELKLLIKKKKNFEHQNTVAKKIFSLEEFIKKL